MNDVNLNLPTVNANSKKTKTSSKAATIGGVIAGFTVANAAKIPAQKIGPKLLEGMQNLSNSLTKSEVAQVQKAVSTTVKESGLSKKGIEIIKATAENAKQVEQILDKEMNSGVLKLFPKKIREILSSGVKGQVNSGNNAFYAAQSKKIVIPEKELVLATFHEAGHAMNANLSKACKYLQKSRQLSMLALPIALIALIKANKKEGEQPKNKLDKAGDFVKKNAGKLTFLTFLPVLLEEGLATLKGNQYAKKLLSPELAKKVAKGNALGFATYALLATFSSVGIYLGVKLKDKITERKANKEIMANTARKALDASVKMADAGRKVIGKETAEKAA